MSVLRSMLAALALAAATSASAGTPTLTELGRLIPGFDNPGRGGYAIGDFDRDGLDDIIVPGAAGTALFQVIGQGPNGIVSKQAVFVPDEYLVRILAVPIASVPHVVTVSREGVVRRYAGWPLTQAHVFQLDERYVNAAAVGDIDQNGAMDLVVSSSWSVDSIRAYALATGALRWSLDSLTANDILLAQLDADPALEIVLARTPGIVIDGATQATDWSYPDGFGSYLASGRFPAGGGNEFVAAHDWDLIMAFQSSPWSPMWDVKMFDVDAVATADFDGDGYDDIIEGDGQWGRINVIDEHTHAVRLTIEHDGSGTSALAAWDPDGNGRPDIAFSPRNTYADEVNVFTLASAVNGAMLWHMPGGQNGPYQALSVGRVAGGTRLAYAYRPNPWRPGGWVEIEALTGQVLWISPSHDNVSSPFFDMSPDDTVHAGGGPNGSLVLIGTSYSANGSRMIALDAQTHALRWIVDGNTLPALTRAVSSATAIEFGDTALVGACLNDYGDSRILLVDAASGAPAWVSVAMATDYNECGIMAGRFTSSGNPLVVAVLDGSLRAYDAVTHSLSWILEGPTDGASLLEQGASGREFVVFEDSMLRFHDAATHALLRTFDLGLPIQAVRQVRGDIRGLLVAADGHLLIVDGITGVIRHATDYLGHNLGKGNRIAAADLGGGYTRVGVGSDGGVIRFRLYTGDGIFDDGFESIVD